MPQGKTGADRAAATLTVPAQHGAVYQRKPEKQAPGPVKGAKSARAAASQNVNFTNALGTMTRNAEMLAAGKLLQEGRILFTGELGRLASAQVDMNHAKRKQSMKDPLAVLERPGRRVKGLRGDVDIDELTELVPSLKRQVQQERTERAKRERDLELEMENVKIRAQASFVRKGGASSAAGGAAAAAAAAVGASLSGGGGGAGALLATASEMGALANPASGGGGGGGGGVSSKRPRPKADTLKRAIDGAAKQEGTLVDGAREDGGDEAEDVQDDDGTAGPTAKRARVDAAAAAAGARAASTAGAGGRKRAAKRGLGSGSRFGVNDTRPGSGAELAPLFGDGGGGAFADL